MNKSELLKKLQDFEATLKKLIIEVSGYSSRAKEILDGSTDYLMLSSFVVDINSARRKNNIQIKQLQGFSDAEVQGIDWTNVLEWMQDRIVSFNERLKYLKSRIYL